MKESSVGKYFSKTTRTKINYILKKEKKPQQTNPTNIQKNTNKTTKQQQNILNVEIRTILENTKKKL